jgi:hypothetical protein
MRDSRTNFNIKATTIRPKLSFRRLKKSRHHSRSLSFTATMISAHQEFAGSSHKKVELPRASSLPDDESFFRFEFGSLSYESILVPKHDDRSGSPEFGSGTTPLGLHMRPTKLLLEDETTIVSFGDEPTPSFDSKVGDDEDMLCLTPKSTSHHHSLSPPPFHRTPSSVVYLDASSDFGPDLYLPSDF